jgi:hypothetical protein
MSAAASWVLLAVTVALMLAVTLRFAPATYARPIGEQ